jgi:hypothetical protein
MYPYVNIVHPGHGASGAKEPTLEDERLYLRTCRAIAAEEIARGGFTDAAKEAAVHGINARFAYTNPTGIKDAALSVASPGFAAKIDDRGVMAPTQDEGGRHL